MPGYFNFFPVLNYSNKLSTNILVKIKFDQSIQNNLAIFYPYTIQQGERADQISERYYGDPTYDWIIYLSNNIVDPYYDWPKNIEEFNEFLIAKYVNLDYAKSKIAFFRVNYLNSESLISPSSYESINSGTKKYFAPVFGYNENIVSYKRKKMDLAIETNKIINLSINSSNGTFTEGEMLYQNTNRGMIEYANSTNLIISKVLGSFSNGSIVGQESSASAVLYNQNLISQSIPDSEASFWEAVDYYTYENEVNESKFNIKILDSSYLNKIVKDVRDLLS